MSSTALALVLIAALLHALWNIAAKKAGGDSRFVPITTAMVVVVWAPVGVWAAWDAVPHWGWLEWTLVAASGITNLVYFNVLLRGYRLSDLSVVYPVARGTGPLISAVKTAPLSHVAPARELSMLFAAMFAGSLLGEVDRGPRILGAACIAGAVIALAFGCISAAR